jgi:hypothetical protein
MHKKFQESNAAFALFYGSGVAFSAERCFLGLKATWRAEKSLCHRGFGGSESSVGRGE